MTSYKRLFEDGEIAIHKLTQEEVLVVNETGGMNPANKVMIRLKDYSTINVYEHELTKKEE